MEEVVTLISNVGFPIACCIALFWHLNRASEMHREEVRELQTVVSNNTVTLQKLIDKMEVSE